jgi:hypothetical protein
MRGKGPADTRKESVLDDAGGLGPRWQSLFSGFREVFTLGGWARLAPGVTGTVLGDEEHTIPQILTSVGLEDQWRNLECLADVPVFEKQ